MNISIFIGSLVALFGIFGIAVFWYKIMTEYNERRGIVFIDTFYSLKIIETKTCFFFLHFIDNIIYESFKEQFNIRIVQLKRDYQRADQTMV